MRAVLDVERLRGRDKETSPPAVGGFCDSEPNIIASSLSSLSTTLVLCCPRTLCLVRIALGGITHCRFRSTQFVQGYFPLPSQSQNLKLLRMITDEDLHRTFFDLQKSQATERLEPPCWLCTRSVGLAERMKLSFSDMVFVLCCHPAQCCYDFKFW